MAAMLFNGFFLLFNGFFQGYIIGSVCVPIIFLHNGNFFTMQAPFPAIHSHLPLIAYTANNIDPDPGSVFAFVRVDALHSSQ